LKNIKGIIVIAGLLLAGCAGASMDSAKADKEKATYIESADEYNSFYMYKVVDKETGCKYLMTKDMNRSNVTMVQMRDENDKPLCE
jgi:uncharacterized protein YceK